MFFFCCFFYFQLNMQHWQGKKPQVSVQPNHLKHFLTFLKSYWIFGADILAEWKIHIWLAKFLLTLPYNVNKKSWCPQVFKLLSVFSGRLTILNDLRSTSKLFLLQFFVSYQQKYNRYIYIKIMLANILAQQIYSVQIKFHLAAFTRLEVDV